MHYFVLMLLPSLENHGTVNYNFHYNLKTSSYISCSSWCFYHTWKDMVQPITTFTIIKLLLILLYLFLMHLLSLERHSTVNYNFHYDWTSTFTSSWCFYHPWKDMALSTTKFTLIRYLLLLLTLLVLLDAFTILRKTWNSQLQVSQ